MRRVNESGREGGHKKPKVVKMIKCVIGRRKERAMEDWFGRGRYVCMHGKLQMIKVDGKGRDNRKNTNR